MASAFSGIIAYGFYNMKGLGDLGPKFEHIVIDEEGNFVELEPGLAGWRWIVRLLSFTISMSADTSLVHHARPPHDRGRIDWMFHDCRLP